MGCTFGRQFILNEDIPGQDSIAVETFECLNLSEADVNCFWRAFIDMDADDSGNIRADEFFAYFHIENTGLNSKIFMTMDSDHSGYLNFCEFVCAMWNFLGMDPNFLGALVFYIFDEDQTNSLEYDEIRTLVETIHHKSGKSAAVKKLIESIMQNHSRVSVEYFTKCCREMSSLCAPLIGMQQSLREKVIGVSFWMEITAKRGQDPIKSRPNFIKVLTDSIAEKKLQKAIGEVELKRLKEEQDKAEAAKKKRNKGKRRRSSYLVQYFTGDSPNEKKPQVQLPAKPRARRSSITLLKPSLLKEGQGKPKGSQVQPAFHDIGQVEDEKKPPLSINVDETEPHDHDSGLGQKYKSNKENASQTPIKESGSNSNTPNEKGRSGKHRSKGEGSESKSADNPGQKNLHSRLSNGESSDTHGVARNSSKSSKKK